MSDSSIKLMMPVNSKQLSSGALQWSLWGIGCKCAPTMLINRYLSAFERDLDLKNRIIIGWVRQLESFLRFMHTFFSFLKKLVFKNYKVTPKLRKLLQDMNYLHKRKSWSFSKQNLFFNFSSFKHQTFCQTFCQKASTTEAEAEGKKASAFGWSFGLRSTPDKKHYV